MNKLQKTVLRSLILSFVLFMVFSAPLKAIENQAVTTKQMRIAVPMFAGKDADIAEALTNTFIRYLQKSDKIQLVERGRTDDILKEMNIESTDAIDQKTAVKFGKMAGVTNLILGDFHLLYGQIQINIGLTDAETGLSVPSASITLKGAQQDILDLAPHLADSFHRALTGVDIPGYCEDSQTKDTCTPDKIAEINPEYLLEHEHADDSNIGLEFKIDREPAVGAATSTFPVYGQGAKMHVTLKADKDCYIAIFNVSADKKVFLLYPNKWRTSGRIKGGETYIIPKKDDDFDLAVSGKPGLESIYVVASGEPLDTIHIAQSKAIGGEAFPQIDSNAKGFTSKTVQAVESMKESGVGVKSAVVKYYVGADTENKKEK